MRRSAAPRVALGRRAQKCKNRDEINSPGLSSGDVLLIESQNSLCSLATLASLTVYSPASQRGVFATPARSPAARAGSIVYLAVPNRSVLCSSRRRQNKTPSTSRDMLGALFWRRPTLARPIAVLPSGLQRFTAVFGMGTGGATALLSPECGTAPAVSLLSQRRRREAESLGTLGRLRSIAPT
jgi:hypothetical protein